MNNLLICTYWKVLNLTTGNHRKQFLETPTYLIATPRGFAHAPYVSDSKQTHVEVYIVHTQYIHRRDSTAAMQSFQMPSCIITAGVAVWACPQSTG